MKLDFEQSIYTCMYNYTVVVNYTNFYAFNYTNTFKHSMTSGAKRYRESVDDVMVMSLQVMVK